MKAHRWKFGDGSRHILAIHCSGSSGMQWAPLANVLGTDASVIAPDLWHHGMSVRAPMSPESLSWRDQVELVCLILDEGEEPVDLIGHSLGGLVATIAAAKRPGKVRSLTLYEPIVLSLVAEEEDLVDNLLPVFERWDAAAPDAWLAGFADYYGEPGSFSALDEGVKSLLRSRAVAMHAEARTVTFDPPDMSELPKIPAAIFYGGETATALQTLACRLAAELGGTSIKVDHAGHMAPLNEGERLAELLANTILSHR